jgi:hypothetical protein
VPLSPETLAILDDLAAELAAEGPIEVATMFRSPGLRTGKKIVVFLGGDDRLLAKLPRERAEQLVSDGEAEPVTLGKRTMREWIAIPARADTEQTLAHWTAISREAFTYVRSLTE